MSLRTAFIPAIAALSIPTLAFAEKPNCPQSVTEAAEKAYAGAKVHSCKEAKEHDGGEEQQYEVKLTTKDGKELELEVGSDGAILQTEQELSVEKVPSVVAQSFAEKYPKAKATRATRSTHDDGSVTYELSFKDGHATKEATFRDDGVFVEEE